MREYQCVHVLVNWNILDILLDFDWPLNDGFGCYPQRNQGQASLDRFNVRNLFLPHSASFSILMMNSGSWKLFGMLTEVLRGLSGITLLFFLVCLLLLKFPRY